MNGQLRHERDKLGVAQRGCGVAIVVVLCSLSAASVAAEKTWLGKFVRIAADDKVTIRTTTGAVSAPLEGVAFPIGGQPGYAESRKLLGELVEGRVMTAVVTTSGDEHLMRLTVQGNSVNLELVRLGGAWHDDRTNASAALAAAQREARDKRRGLWAAAAEPVAPWKWAEHCRELAVAEFRARVAEFRTSLDVPQVARAPALATLGRAIEAMGGAENLRRLERARIHCELRGAFSEWFKRDAEVAVPGQVAWELPDRLKASVLVSEPALNAPATTLTGGFRVFWNRPKGLAEAVLIQDEIESQTKLFGSIPSGREGEDRAFAYATSLGVLRDLLTLTPLTDESRYAIRAAAAREGEPRARGDVIQLFPRCILDPPPGGPALDIPWLLEWFQIEFDPETKQPARWRVGKLEAYVRSEKLATFGTLTLCSEWSLRNARDEAQYRVTITKLELPDKFEPQEFALPAPKPK